MEHTNSRARRAQRVRNAPAPGTRPLPPRAVPYDPPMDFRIISIGTLAVNSLWREREPTRTGHATTTLIREAKRRLGDDPRLDKLESYLLSGAKKSS